MNPDENNQPAVDPVTTPVAPVAPVSKEDQVWISKEEYQRLQQTSTPVIASGATTKSARLFSNLQIASTTIAALALIAGLLLHENYASTWMITPAIIVLILNGIFTLVDYLAAQKPGQVLKSHKVRNIILLVVACLALIAPALVAVVVVLFFVLLCATGGCKGT